MNRVPVSSLNLRSVGYDQTTNTLEVEFNHGGIYQYFCVPPHVHSELMKAPSKSRYLYVNVKKAGYSYRKV
ncbi:KTSC domain-containing protein [Morganella morganii]|nr:KTSC domain-containing protein [Morganella morganii]